uniref:ribosomal protein S6 kinase alpha-2-like n=1 Tax=Myxine glutinosa TaxID=7769 RepID=UPI00358E3006
MKEMADAFEYLHARNIVHRDIKLDNVLFSSCWIIKVIDFNMATPFIHGKKLYNHWSTSIYMAPEILEDDDGYEGPPVDVWALGVLFTKLFDGLHFNGHKVYDMSHDKTHFNVGNSQPTFSRETLVSLLTAMLWNDPMERLTMTEIVNHMWFKENNPMKHKRNAESKLSDVSVEEEPLTGEFGSSLHHGKDDEIPCSDEDKEYHVGQVVFRMWEVISKIGEGSAGFIYKAKNIDSAEEVALKKARSLENSMELWQEASIMKALNHPNIMKLIDIPTEDTFSDRIVLVMEYVEAGSLASQILYLRSLTERNLWHPMKQMADAFEYLHARNIVHRDIKLDNVLFSSCWIIKVIDFNMATPFIHGKKLYNHWSTSIYMAPEILEDDDGYEGPPVDVWALGVLFTKLFDGLHFNGHKVYDMSHDKTHFNVGNSQPTFSRETLVSLLTAMLWNDPMERLTMTEIVNHMWFKENNPMKHKRNAESKLSDVSVEEEPLTGEFGSSLHHGKDDEIPCSDEDKEYHVGQVVFRMWEVISKIGEGSAGFIYKAKNIDSAEEVALKKARSLENSMELWQEASIMKALNHPNIMKLIDIPTEDTFSDRIVLVMEYVEAGSLASQILYLRSLTERNLWHPMKQMADAFEYLHARNIVHRDIKLDNVLFSSCWIIKVIDFNMATPFIHGKKLYNHWSTSIYMAPEILEDDDGYEGPPVDVWALGVLFTKLFDGLHFNGHKVYDMSHDKTHFNVGNSQPTFSRETLVSLLTAMLWNDPMERLTMTEIVNHMWFKENNPMKHKRNAV